MNETKWATLFFYTFALVSQAAASGFRERYEEWMEPAAPYLDQRLEAGLRFSYFRFKEADRATVGPDGTRGGYAPGISTYTLAEKQSYIPRPYLRYHFTPAFGVQLSWERLEGETGTRDAYTLEPYTHSNGNAILSGPSLMLYGRYPFDHFAPYAGIGLVRFFGDFNHNAWWHERGRRNMAVEDATGHFLAMGTSIRIHEAWTVDGSFQYLHARPKARYWMQGDRHPRAEWVFPMESWVFHAGLIYLF